MSGSRELTPGNDDIVQHLATICTTILKQPDDASIPAIDAVVEQLRSVNCADNSCSTAMYALKYILKQALNRIEMM